MGKIYAAMMIMEYYRQSKTKKLQALREEQVDSIPEKAKNAKKKHFIFSFILFLMGIIIIWYCFYQPLERIQRCVY